MISVQPRTRAVSPVGAVLAVVDILFLLVLFILIGGNYVSFSALNAQMDNEIVATGGFADPVVLALPRGGGIVLAGRQYSDAELETGLENFFGSQTFDVLVVPESGVSAERLLRILTLLNGLGQNSLVADPSQDAQPLGTMP